jgi:hypothetical protein
MTTTINTINNLETLTTTVTSEWAFKAHLTTEQNIILNATLHCIGSISGEMATSERMISWLASCGIEGIIIGKANSIGINIPFAWTLVDSEGIQDLINIRLGHRTVSGRWFIYATCIGQLGLPVSMGKHIQVRIDTDS